MAEGNVAHRVEGAAACLTVSIPEGVGRVGGAKILPISEPQEGDMLIPSAPGLSG